MSWKNWAACAALAALSVAMAGCATRKVGAPVIDRLPPRAGAPAKPAAPQAAAPAPEAPAPEGFYVVKRGDTLYSIALEHGADYREVAQWNSLDDPTRIRVGQLLRIRAPEEAAQAAVKVAPARGTGRIEARPLESSPAPQQQASAPPQKPAPQPAPQPPKPAPEKAAAEAPPGAEAAFIWPAKGKVIGTFQEPRSKGIDIDGKPGDPVVAAAPGRVTYIGTGIPGLGKLVVIKHDNGFITVYAHNREIVVKEQQSVARGQKIAELGQSDAERPKLHFQIRKGSAPVDPLRYLPAS